MSDLRSSGRIRTYLGGRVTLADRTSAIGCLVRDMSTGGAQLVMMGAAELPSEIKLDIPRIKLATRARVVWRNGDVCGVQFLESAPPLFVADADCDRGAVTRVPSTG